MLNRLNSRAAQSINEPGKYADGGGLYLVVTKTATRSWSFRFTFAGRAREAGLGSARDVSLAEARAIAAEYRSLLARGIDPLASKIEAAPTFATLADTFIREQARRWRDPKAPRDWNASLQWHAGAILSMPIDKIAFADVLAVLRPIWLEKPEAAAKLRSRIERIIDAGIAQGFRADNPARWKGSLSLVLPPRVRLSRGHHAALPYEELPAFVAALRERQADSARLLEFMILTAARSGEARGALWEEFNLRQALWTIPAGRMKAGKEHRVPLTARAMQILEAQQAENVGDRRSLLVFPNDYGRVPSVSVFNALFRRMAIAGVTAHGFRSTFRDWAGNETEHAREIIEAALAHAVGDAVERAYRRSDALVRRRKLMEDWEAFVT